MAALLLNKVYKNSKLGDSESGFVLLESIVSLTILAVFVGVVLPFFFSLFHTREAAKREVELNRFVYESSLFWETEAALSSFSSDTIQAASHQSNRSITIYVDGVPSQSMKVESVEWKRSEP